jgi:4-oxalocrotonate tautomerase family enzyme
MAQIKIYARREWLAEKRTVISEALHRCVVGVLGLPAEKRFQRFMPLDAENFLHPPDRSARYTIVEIDLFTGRTPETKKTLIRRIFSELQEAAGLAPQDVEITLHESPKENWGIRGLPGDELALSYRVEK